MKYNVNFIVDLNWLMTGACRFLVEPEKTNDRMLGWQLENVMRWYEE